MSETVDWWNCPACKGTGERYYPPGPCGYCDGTGNRFHIPRHPDRRRKKREHAGDDKTAREIIAGALGACYVKWAAKVLREEHEEDAAAILAALAAAGITLCDTATHAVVPRDPTPAMFEAA